MGKKTLMVLVVLGVLLSSCAGKNNRQQLHLHQQPHLHLHLHRLPLKI